MANTQNLNLMMHWTYKGLQVETIDLSISPTTNAYGTSVGVCSQTKDDVIEALKKGFSFKAFDTLQKEMGISTQVLAKALHIADRTLTRRKTEGRFQTGESERLLRLGTLFDKAVDVLGKREDAQHWFMTPQKALGGQTPLEYADTELGAREIEDLLGRLEYGVFS